MIKKFALLNVLILALSFSASASILQAEAARADAALNEAYQNLLVTLRSTFGEKSKAESMLRDAQRTWITYRDQKCAFESNIGGDGGDSQPSSKLDCLATTAQARAQELQANANSLGDK